MRLPATTGPAPWQPVADYTETDTAFFAIRRVALSYYWSMIFSDLPAPAEASNQMTIRAKGFAQAGNRFPLFGIMLVTGHLFA
jgi:hypothetical protein